MLLSDRKESYFVIKIPKLQFDCLSRHPGLHPDTSVQIPYSLLHDSDQHDILQLYVT